MLDTRFNSGALAPPPTGAMVELEQAVPGADQEVRLRWLRLGVDESQGLATRRAHNRQLEVWLVHGNLPGPENLPFQTCELGLLTAIATIELPESRVPRSAR